MPTSNIKEKIDERILRLLGIQDVFDIDYDTYLTLLKEAMVKGRMPKTSIPTEEMMILNEEYKRIKPKKGKGRFEVGKKKLTSKSFSVSNTSVKTTKKLLPPSKELAKSPVSKNLENNIAAITSGFISIVDTLKSQRKVSESSKDYNRRKSEQEKREIAENKLEKKFGILTKTAEKIIAPVKSLLDKVLNFFTTVVFGRIVYKLVEWMGNPENASKVKSIIRFTKDWWPALLGSYILFGTSFGKLVRGTVGMVGRFIFQIGKVAIPQLLKFINTPIGRGLALFTAGATIPAMFPGTVNEQERKTSKQSGSKEEKIKELQRQKANLNFFEILQGKGSEIDEQIEYLRTGKTKSYGFSGGGFNGFVSGEKGVDKVPAMLSDGEFVMSRGAVQLYGLDTLEAMNAAGGGTNRPKIVSGVPHAAGGGRIGRNIGGPGYAEGNEHDLRGYINRFFRGSGAGSKFDIGNPLTWNGKSGGNHEGKSTGMRGGIAGTIGRRLQYEYNKRFNTEEKPSRSNKNDITGTIGRRLQYEYNKMFGNKPSKTPSTPGSRTSEGYGSDKSDVFGGLKRTTYKDAGAVFLRSLMGFGGDLTEKDFSPESQRLLQQAIKRAESRQAQKIKKAQAELAKDPNNEEKKSSLKRLLAGQIRLEYGDYASKIEIGPDGKYKPIYTEAEDDLKNILGQAWFQKQKSGGYRSTNEKYDFQKYQAPLAMLAGITAFENKDVQKSGVNFQKRLEAIHQIASSPASIFGKQFADMVEPYKNTPIGRMLGIGGMAKDLRADVMLGGKRPGDNPRNVKALESKRPWWDKMGLFGGASAQIQKEQKERQDFLKKNPGTKLYTKPQKPSGPYKSKFAKPKNAAVKPVGQLPKPKPKVTVAKTYRGGQRGSGSNPSSSKTPNFSAATGGSRSKAKTLGITR